MTSASATTEFDGIGSIGAGDTVRVGPTQTSVPTTTVRVTDHDANWASLVSRTYFRQAETNPSHRSHVTSSDASGMASIPRNRVLVGDALASLGELPSNAVDAVITSPPYFLLRDYQHDGQIGAEANIDSYVTRIVAVADQIHRVLKPYGTFWLNLGDSYSRATRYGAPPKSLLLAPERILIALAEQGWIVRNKIVWAKPNPMPSSVGDRLTCSWEPLYLLTRTARYYFDLDAIRQPHRSSRRPSTRPPRAKYGGHRPSWAGPLAGSNDGLIRAQAEGRTGHPLGKNPGDVWTIATSGYQGAHYASFPTRLIEPAVLAAVPERICETCAKPWRRTNSGLVPGCDCPAGWRPGIVLDPFIGSGTVAVAAEHHQRDWLGIELNAEYARLANDRIERAHQQRGRDQRNGRRDGRRGRVRPSVDRKDGAVQEHQPRKGEPKMEHEKPAGAGPQTTGNQFEQLSLFDNHPNPNEIREKVTNNELRQEWSARVAFGGLRRHDHDRRSERRGLHDHDLVRGVRLEGTCRRDRPNQE